MTAGSHPKIVVVGRPNVGKSSLFNRMIGARKAIVEAASGTTRDRLHAELKIKGRTFTIVDTGGFEPAKPGAIAALVLRQLESAINEADIIFFVTDTASGLTPLDAELAGTLRKTSKKIYLVANKADDTSRAQDAAEFYSLGLGEPYPVSAVNGTGIERLLSDASSGIERDSHDDAVPSGSAPVKVAIVGRPNVGKSSFVNAVFNEERVIVHEVPGTTRDAIDTDFAYKGTDYVLIDTAGMRHNTKLKEAADFFSSVRSKEAVKRCDAAIVMIDGFDGLREDDKRVIEYVIEEGKALVLAVNKWDLAKGADASLYGEMLIKSLNCIKNYPVIFMSCKTRRNVLSCIDAASAAYRRSGISIPPPELKNMLKEIGNTTEIKGRRLHLLYLRQEGSCPPRFIVGVHGGRVPGESVKRFLENFFRRKFDLEGVPVKINYDIKKARKR